MTRFARLLTPFRIVVAVVLVMPLLGGCARADEDSEGITYVSGLRRVGPSSASVSVQAQAPRDNYLGIRGNRGVTNGFGFACVPWDVWAPFRYEGRVGVFDQTRYAASNLARVAIELDGRATNPLQFYGINSEVINNGLNVFAYSHTSPTAHGSHFFAGAREVEVAIEVIGDTMFFNANVPKGKKIELASIPFTNQTVPLLPCLGASNLAANGEAAFDFCQITQNGDSPFKLEEKQVLSKQIWEGLAPTLSAGYKLDGETPDFSEAGADLAEAAPLMETAVATAQTFEFGSTKLNKKNRKALEGALKNVRDAIRRVNQQNRKKALTEIGAAIQGAGNVAITVYPHDDAP
jgi:hypothetical protein